MRGGGQGDVDTIGAFRAVFFRLVGNFPVAGSAEIAEETLNAGEGLGAREVLALESVELFYIFLVVDGELGPFLKQLVRGRAWPTLQLGLDAPGKGAPLVFLEDKVDAKSVNVFRIEEETIHVEKTGPNRREAGHCQHLRYLGWTPVCCLLCSWGHVYVDCGECRVEVKFSGSTANGGRIRVRRAGVR